jgi:hypothetical protein
MKTKLLALLAASLALTGVSVPGANIAWVSFHPGDDTPSANATNAGFTNAPDKGYTALLTANGHNVTRFPSVDLDATAFPDQIAAFNTNDLVIVSRSVGSGQYELANETAAWNGLTVPLMSLNGYIDRANRLGFNTGNTIPDINSNPVRLRIIYKSHPIFAGLALDSTNLMVNPYAQIARFTNAITGVATNQRGISVVTEGPVAGGSVLARVGTPGDAAFNGMMIGEFPAGTTSQRGDVLAAKRFIFLTGCREQAGISSETAGIFDLLPDGQQLFLNAVTYLTTAQPPLPPECTVALVGATNLIDGDTWTFDAGVAGDTPRTYQWYKNGQPVPTGTDVTLVFASLTAADAGEYQLFVTNAAGWATSTLARLEFKVFPPTSITNSLISYWPLDAVLGTKSVDLVSSYDMSLVNLDATNLVPGKFGNAFQFNGTNSLLARTHNTNDALPIYQHPEFSVSLWVNGLPQTDRRVFSEGTPLFNGNPLFNLGTHNTAADGSVDIFIRNNTGTARPNHAHSTGFAFDGAIWHNIVYVQRDIGGGNMRAQVWVDGVQDSILIEPIRPLSAVNTSIGGIRRASDSAWFNGMIDEVAVWNRALSAAEIGVLQVTAITNPPSRVQPLVISSFKADLPAVVTGGSTILRWDVSKDASQVTITPFGDVTAQTAVGIGSRSITQTVAQTYVLTVNRGIDSLSATTSVAVVNGVAPGWTLLDNFDQAALGNLFASGYWNDTSGSGGQVVTVNGNRALRATSSGISFLNLRDLSIQETQTCTLFFRVIAGEANAAVATNIVGLTDKSQRSFGDADDNIGSVLYVTPFTNDLVGITTNGWYLGARNGVGSLPDYIGSQPVPQTALEAQVVYNVWVDITNAPLADFANDVFSVYLQKEGGAPRAVLFQDYISDRDLFLVDPVLGGIAPNLDKLVVMDNSATFSSIFDDFYLSRGAYNATVPIPYSVIQPPLGPLSVGWVGNQLQISWPTGTLQSSTNVAGPYVDVSGNPTSPYLVAPTGERTFYRSRQ